MKNKFNFTVTQETANNIKHNVLFATCKGLFRHYSLVRVISDKTITKALTSQAELIGDFIRAYKHFDKSFRKPRLTNEKILKAIEKNF